jgi:transposase-like protein
MRKISNGTSYPVALRVAAVQRSVSADLSVAKVAAEFNISKSTVSTWRRDAGVQRDTPPQIAAYLARNKSAKQFNTPTVQKDGGIMYKGKLYK